MAVAAEPHVVGEKPDVDPPDPQPSPPPPPLPDPGSERRQLSLPVTPRAIGAVALAWVLVTVIGMGLVVYGMGPMLEERDQRNLLSEYRADIRHSANEAFGLPGIEEVTEAPAVGDPVAIVEINAIHFRQVVVEGVGPQQTRRGPGHVPGTAGPGQPGNSVVVGRKTAFGGQFSQLDELARGDEIVVVTTQGRSLYEITKTSQRRVHDGNEGAYGPTHDDRLTLLTSDSTAPWSTNPATVVEAKLKTVAFRPTPQGGRTLDPDGRDRDGSALAPVLLATLGYICAAAGAVVLYRRTRPRSAYLMSAPLLLAATVLLAEASARLLPAWA